MTTTSEERIEMEADKAPVCRVAPGVANVCNCDCHYPGRGGIVMMHIRACCGHLLENLDPRYQCPVCGETFKAGDEGVDVYRSYDTGEYGEAYHRRCCPEGTM